MESFDRMNQPEAVPVEPISPEVSREEIPATQIVQEQLPTSEPGCEPNAVCGNPTESKPPYGNPGVSNPPYGNPGVSNPPYGNPGVSNPPYGDPGMPNPVYGNSGVSNPPYGNPGVSNPPYGDPGMPNPVYGNPGASNPPYGNPGMPDPMYGNFGMPANPYMPPIYPAPRYPGYQGPLVSCRGLTKNYGPICALDNVNLQLTPGKIVGLLGPNGSGKTTLIKILTGLLQSFRGEVEICGFPVGPDTKVAVSYLPDKMFFADWMRASDLLDLFQDFFPDFRRDRAEAMCAGLAIPMKTKIKNMSKGTQEKLQLIVTMARRARLYLLDEPIAGVDPAAREFILRTIMSNCEPESTVVISTHLILDVEPILDEAIFLQRGRIVCYDSVENIRTREGKSLDELFREIFRMPIQYGAMGGMW